MAKKDAFCPVETTLYLITGKWKVMIVYYLLQDTKRFNQLQRDLNNVTHRTLSKQLKEMEDSGLVIRTDYGEIPPRVDYKLSPLGMSLKPVLDAMHEWGEAYENGMRK